MKLFLQYIKYHRRTFFMILLFGGIFLASFLLYHLPLAALAYPALLCLIMGLLLLIFDFRRTREKHRSLEYMQSNISDMEDVFPPAEGIGEEDYQEIIRLMREEQGRFHTYKDQEYTEMVDYYTVWAHQIKTPIASMRLTLQNEDSPLSRRIYADLQRIEQYVEMVLTFLRLNSDSTDYVFKEYHLDNIIRQSVKKYSHEFIGRKIRLDYEPINATVITDEKWLSFVVEQVLSNALKYTKTGSITIAMDEQQKLSIHDTGIGISPEDLPRIFENGYTGYNGRMDKRASGIGLYLCKRICSNLGHHISAQSVVGEGTTIFIDLARKRVEAE